MCVSICMCVNGLGNVKNRWDVTQLYSSFIFFLLNYQLFYYSLFFLYKFLTHLFKVVSLFFLIILKISVKIENLTVFNKN